MDEPKYIAAVVNPSVNRAKCWTLESDHKALRNIPDEQIIWVSTWEDLRAELESRAEKTSTSEYSWTKNDGYGWYVNSIPVVNKGVSASRLLELAQELGKVEIKELPQELRKMEKNRRGYDQQVCNYRVKNCRIRGVSWSLNQWIITHDPRQGPPGELDLEKWVKRGSLPQVFYRKLWDAMWRCLTKRLGTWFMVEHKEGEKMVYKDYLSTKPVFSSRAAPPGGKMEPTGNFCASCRP